MPFLINAVRFWIVVLFVPIAFEGAALRAVESEASSSKASETVPAEAQPEEKEPQKAEKKKKRRSSRERVNLEDLSPAERIRMQRQMGDVDLYSKGNVAFRKSWGFRSGVSELYPPFYEGWANGRDTKEGYEPFAGNGAPGDTLSSVIYNERFYKATGSEFVNFYVLIWVPEEFAFSLLTPSSFQGVKDKVREQIIDSRKTYVDRDRFETFNDYIAFKFGRDEEVENFVDGYWIEANEGPTHLTYFYTSEFLLKKKKEAFVRPLIATATYVIVRNKSLKIEIIQAYQSQEDVARLLEFTERFLEDMEVVNRHGKTDQ